MKKAPLNATFPKPKKNSPDTDQTDEQLKQRYQTLAEILPVGIFHADADGYTTYVNPRWCQISGLSYEEALGNGWFNAVHKDDRAGLGDGWKQATRSSEVATSEYRFVRPDGSIAWVIGQAAPEKNSKNEIVGWVGTTTDITERKKAEEEIARVYIEKETVLNRINDAMISVDAEWRYTFLNDAALATHPLGKEETLGKVIWDVHPEMKGTIFWDKYHEAMETGKDVEIESVYAPMNTWFSVKIYPSHDGLTIIYKDISERKKIEETITRNEQKLELIYNTTKDVVFLLSVEDNRFYFTSVNQSFLDVTGLTKEQVVGKYVDEIIPEPSLSQVISKYRAAIAGKETLQWEETSLYPTGAKTGIVSITPVFDSDDVCNMLVGSVHDITELKKNQNEIIKEKNLSDSIINSLPGVFYLYTKEGKFLKWNKNLEDVSMYSGEEVAAMHPLDFFGEEEKPLLMERIANVFTKGEDSVQASFVRKDKQKMPYYFTGKAIVYEGTICLVGVGIDFSERVKAQEMINATSEQLRLLTAHLQNIREEERRRIGREIHDELGQQLTAIKMDVAWVDKKIPSEDVAVKSKLKNVIALLDSGNKSVRRILNELRPIVLQDYGLIETLKWQGRQFTANTGIPLEFKIQETQFDHTEEIATCIFRVYQEALTNITRYAQAGKVIVSLNIVDDSLVLNIEDDGKGFDVADLVQKKSFGILGMKERVISVNGLFDLVTAPGKGTKINICVPLKIKS